MNFYSIFLLFLSSFSIGVMSLLRKYHQQKNGSGYLSLLVFSLISSLVATVIGWFISGGITLEPMTFFFATLTGVLGTISAAVCICAANQGNVSILMLNASLGGLFLPSIYSLIFVPEENTLSLLKIIGYILTLVCLALTFISSNNKSEKKSGYLFSIFCIIVFIITGTTPILFNLKSRLCSWYSAESFVAEYMLISTVFVVILLIAYAISHKKTIKTEIKPMLSKAGIIIPAVYSVFFFLSDTLVLLCMDLIPLIVQTPLFFTFRLICTAALEYAIFKVKLSKIMVLQMVLAVLCSLCFVL